jgi:hypothetical protein
MSTALGSLAVSRVMSTLVKTTSEYDTTENACKMMVQNNIGSIVVTAQSHSNQLCLDLLLLSLYNMAFYSFILFFLTLNYLFTYMFPMDNIAMRI